MYIGLDLGTSGLKALLIDENGDAVASQTSTYDVSHPHPGWSEQDPAVWIEACKSVLSSLRSTHGAQMSAVRAIGLSGHMHGATLLDAQGAVLRPCMLWNDTRSHEQAADLDAQPAFRDLSGNIVFPGFTAPKLMWVQTHEPDLFARVAKVLLPKDYLRFWLTGTYVSDMSDSAGTSWLDTGKRAWSSRLIEGSGMSADQMPDLCEGTDATCELRADLAAELGLPQGVIIAGGGGDNAAAACGAGCFREGDGFVSLGTSGVLLAARDAYRPDPATAVHSFCHALPDTWYQMGVILSATDCMNWLSRITGETPQALSSDLTTEKGPADLMFLPYLSGERTPHNDASVRGAFIGLDVSHEPKDMARAVMEGVTYALKDCLQALEKTGANLSSLLAMGGGSGSDFWVQTLANVLNMPIELPKDGDFGAALGAARLAWVASGEAAAEDVMVRPPIGESREPISEHLDAYEQAYQRYTSLYAAVR